MSGSTWEPSSSPWSSSGDAAALPPFERTYRQIVEEERQLRQLAEARLREYAALVQEFASLFLADELDAQKKADPGFLAQASVADWRRLLGQARGQAARSRSWTHDVTALQAENARLRAELARLETVGRATPSTAADDGVVVEKPDDGQRSSETLADELPERVATGGPVTGSGPAGRSKSFPALMRPGVRPAQQTQLLIDPAHVPLPAMPTLPPVQFAGVLPNWPREAIVLAGLATTGWSLRLALTELLAAQIDAQPASTNLRRLFDNLVARNLLTETKVLLEWNSTGEGNATAARGDARGVSLLIVQLSQTGHAVLRACGIEPVPSEWERLAGRQSGAELLQKVAMACTFTYQARRRGLSTVVCPDARVGVEPDVLVAQPDGRESLYVAVEAEAASPEERVVQWRKLAAAQGTLALVARTSQARETLVNQARTVGIAPGMAADLQTLVQGQAAGVPLWSVEW